MIKFDILNRFTGAIQFSADIDCGPDVIRRVKLGLAIRIAVENKADLFGAYLSGADLSRADLFNANLSGAYLSGADLFGANLSRANLSGASLFNANLSGADLSGANLFRANLSGANLSGADLSGQPIIDCGLRSDGYRFLFTCFPDEGPRIKAGCRNFSMSDARRHWNSNRGGTQLGYETNAILDHIERIAHVRGLAVHS